MFGEISSAAVQRIIGKTTVAVDLPSVTFLLRLRDGSNGGRTKSGRPNLKRVQLAADCGSSSSAAAGTCVGAKSAMTTVSRLTTHNNGQVNMIGRRDC